MDNNEKCRRKVDWGRIITAYGIPFFILVGTAFVLHYRMAQAENDLDNKVDKSTHVAEHKTIELRFERNEQHIQETRDAS